MTEEERIRYARIIALPEIGRDGVERLRRSHVFVIGCGALGSLCAMYLAGAGVGQLSIADFDSIDLSNLQRQLFYSETETGRSKAEILARRLHELNSDVRVNVHSVLLSSSNAGNLLRDADFVIDATDNPASKFHTDKICCQLSLPCCIGGVAGFTGQLMSWAPGHTRYSDIFSPEGTEGGMLPCTIGGVHGPAAGVIASLQASEAIKHLSGAGQMLYNKIFTIDLLTMQSALMEVD